MPPRGQRLRPGERNAITAAGQGAKIAFEDGRGNSLKVYMGRTGSPVHIGPNTYHSAAQALAHLAQTLEDLERFLASKRSRGERPSKAPGSQD